MIGSSHNNFKCGLLRRFFVFVVLFTAGFFMLYAGVVLADTNIHSTTTDHWAWNDVIGWINFYETQNVMVNSWGLSGYASSSVGEIALDCATSPRGNVCGQSDFGVKNNRSGLLSGWGWNDLVGWVSFCGTTGVATSGCPLTAYNYGVVVMNPNTATDTPPSDFFNYAWNDAVGWISFNCSDVPPGACPTYSSDPVSYADGYKVRTDWAATSTYGYLESSVFDTGMPLGAIFNSITWTGSRPFGTDVFFQFAASNSPSGPWNFTGPDGTSGSYYSSNVVSNMNDTFYANLSVYQYSNQRYFRYKIRLKSDSTQSQTPEVHGIVVNWSP